MLYKIAFIGYGFVGKAAHKAFQHNCEAIIIDPKYTNISVSDLSTYNPEIIFIAINAPTLTDSSVDSSIIYTIFRQLVDINYKGIVVLKSTLPPTTVMDINEKFGRTSDTNLEQHRLRFVYSPEFLRENNWEYDATHPQMIILAGDIDDCRAVSEIYERESQIKNPQFCYATYIEAAFAKYTINTFLAAKLVFFNQLYKTYSDLNGGAVSISEWQNFLSILRFDSRMGNSHMQVPGPDGLYGYGGSCFPKDVKAMIGFDKHERLSLLRETELANTKIRLTGDEESRYN